MKSWDFFDLIWHFEENDASHMIKKQTNKSKNKPTSLLLLLHVGCPQEGSAGVSTWVQPEPELNQLPRVPPVFSSILKVHEFSRTVFLYPSDQLKIFKYTKIKSEGKKKRKKRKRRDIMKSNVVFFSASS